MMHACMQGAAKTLTANDPDWTKAKSQWISGACAAGMAALTACTVLPLLWWRANKKFAAA